MNATEDTSHSSVESYKQTSKVSPNSPTDTSENSRSSNDSTIVTQKAISKSPERVAEKMLMKMVKPQMNDANTLKGLILYRPAVRLMEGNKQKLLDGWKTFKFD